jgi:hypothetical protein
MISDCETAQIFPTEAEIRASECGKAAAENLYEFIKTMDDCPEKAKLQYLLYSFSFPENHTLEIRGNIWAEIEEVTNSYSEKVHETTAILDTACNCAGELNSYWQNISVNNREINYNYDLLESLIEQMNVYVEQVMEIWGLSELYPADYSGIAVPIKEAFDKGERAKLAASDGLYRSKRRRSEKPAKNNTDSLSEKTQCVCDLSPDTTSWLQSLYAQFKTVIDYRAVHGNQFEKAQAQLILKAISEQGESPVAI